MHSSFVSGEGSFHGARMKDMQDSPVTSLHLMPLGARKQNPYFADSGSLAGSSKPLGPSTPVMYSQSLLTTQSIGPSTPLMATQSLLTTQSMQSLGPSTPPAPATPPPETPLETAPSRSAASASGSVSSLDDLRKSVYGSHEIIPTPFGPRTLVYMDWAASGRLLKPLEVREHPEPGDWPAPRAQPIAVSSLRRLRCQGALHILTWNAQPCL